MEFLKFEDKDVRRDRLRNLLQRKALFAGGAVLAFALALFIISIVSKVWSSSTPSIQITKPKVEEQKPPQASAIGVVTGSYAGTTPDIGKPEDRVYGPPLPTGEYDYVIEEDDTLTSVLSPYGIEHAEIAKWAAQAGKKCNLDKMRVGEQITIGLTEGQLKQIQIACSEIDRLIIKPDGKNGASLEFKTLPFE